jgi:hypothetical protein
MFAEFDRARLAKKVETESDVMPIGAVGIVMHVYPDGMAYEVEFIQPFHEVLTVAPDEIEHLNA